MSPVKVTYVVCSLIWNLALLGVIVSSPAYWTPGYYWLSVVAFYLLCAAAGGFSKRLNGWDGMGEV